jgi:hypothetical protein
MVGAGECPVICRLVAEYCIDEGVVRHFVPNRWSAWRQSALRTGDPGQLFILDLDRIRRAESLRQGFGHHHRDRFADMPDLVGRQQGLRADKDRAAARPGQLQIVSGRGDRAVRDWG